MSYAFKLVAKDGVVTLSEDSTTTHVPDGTFHISGHEDAASRTISATRCDETGRTVISTNGVGYLPVPAGD